MVIAQKLTAQLELPPEFSNETTLSPTVKFLGFKVFLGIREATKAELPDTEPTCA
jgi:hypothetical protein